MNKLAQLFFACVLIASLSLSTYNALEVVKIGAGLHEVSRDVKLLKENQSAIQSEIDALQTNLEKLESEQAEIEGYINADIPLPASLQLYTIQQANAENIPPEIMFAIMEQESGFDADCVYYNRDGSTDYGLCQINSSNFGWLREEYGLNPMDTRDNIKAACIILRRNLDKAGGDLLRALTGYNTGNCTYVNEYAREVVGIWES